MGKRLVKKKSSKTNRQEDMMFWAAPNGKICITHWKVLAAWDKRHAYMDRYQQSISLPDHGWLVKLFYKDDDNAAALHVYSGLKAFCKGPLMLLKWMVQWFEETGSFTVWGWITSTPQVTEDVTKAVVKQSSWNVDGVYSGHTTAWQLDLLYTTIWWCLQNTLETYPHKLHRHYELQPDDVDSYSMLVPTFLAHMQMDDN